MRGIPEIQKLKQSLRFEEGEAVHFFRQDPCSQPSWKQVISVSRQKQVKAAISSQHHKRK
jgi:hypothetical protein